TGSVIGVGGGSLEFDTNGRFVAQIPGIVTGGDSVHRAAGDLSGGSVVVLDAQAAGHHLADVFHLARVRADHRLDALGPAPTGLEGEPADLAAADLDHLDGCAFGAANLVGRREVVDLQSCHVSLLSSVDERQVQGRAFSTRV